MDLDHALIRARIILRLVYGYTSTKATCHAHVILDEYHPNKIPMKTPNQQNAQDRGKYWEQI